MAVREIEGCGWLKYVWLAGVKKASLAQASFQHLSRIDTHYFEMQPKC
jgi:hypothetical protein